MDKTPIEMTPAAFACRFGFAFRLLNIRSADPVPPLGQNSSTNAIAGIPNLSNLVINLVILNGRKAGARDLTSVAN